MIKLTAIGHLGKDATVNDVNGKKVINFSVAHTEKYKDRNGTPTSKTTWIECAWWNDSLNIVPYLKKGVQVYVEGSPSAHAWIHQTGDAMGSLRLNIRAVQLLGSKQESSNNDQQPGNTGTLSSPYSGANDITEPVDDLPF